MATAFSRASSASRVTTLSVSINQLRRFGLRARVPRVRFVRNTAQEAPIPVCSAVVSVDMSFSFAFAGDRRGSQALRFFRKIRKTLLSGGIGAARVPPLYAVQ